MSRKPIDPEDRLFPRLPEEIAADLSTIQQRFEEIADLLRQTADELHSGMINPHHAANRIRKIADEIARPR